MKIIPLAAVAVLATLTACSPRQTPEQAAASSASAAAESSAISTAATDAASQAVSGTFAAADYAGKWTGPEATSLTLTPQGNDFQVVVQNLDGPRTFDGKLSNAGITFVRDGAPFVIHKGDGLATGMKDLAAKTDCLIVAPGEGYCRN